MPVIKSAKKRVRVSSKATARNVKTKRNLRSAIKSFSSLLTTGGNSKTIEAQKKAQSAIDIAGKKNVMHKNKVARKQRQLSAKAKAAGVKISAAKKQPVKKTVTKKTVKK